MRLWIDATSSGSTLRVFGMSLLERHLRALLEAGLAPTAVYIRLAADAPPTFPLPDDLLQRFPVQWVRGRDPLSVHLASAIKAANGEPFLGFAADTVIDTRLLHYLAGRPGAAAVWGGEGSERAVVVRLEGTVPLLSVEQVSVAQLAEAGIAQGVLTEVPLRDVPSYIKKLRRDLPAYLFAVPDAASRDRAERFLFWSNYKGSTDFFTKYVYPPLVWRMVRPLARWRVHPNVVTLFNVFITFAAVPLFAQAYWLLGFLCSYTMSVLDSVDGKLARLTFRSSRFGDILDHGLDLVHPPLWYFGWAWALGAGNLSAPVFQAAVWMAIFYICDRLVTALFNLRTGRSIHGYAPVDVRMRTFISRRNINLPLFTVGLLAGMPIPTFSLIVLWQIVTLAFHAARLAQCWHGRAALIASE